ncbi:MAG: carbohydrate ABC transporter permease [Alphaproteobacteria bacterium]|nr:carbohydrate ABC transporter permease [Alphaproteobacteria bacterium]
MFDLTRPLSRLVFLALLASIGTFLFFPLYWLVSTSFKTNAELFRVVPTIVPLAPTLENFVDALTRGTLPRNLLNSVIAAGGSAILTTVLATCAGFSFAKYRYRGRIPLMYALLAAQVIPHGVLLISVYPMLSDWNLLNTYPGLILAYLTLALPAGCYMMYSYFVNLPHELIEAARADGASELLIMRRIVLPISWPAVITVFLYAFMWAWNDLQFAMTILTATEMRTVGPGLLYNYLNEQTANWGAAMAASLLAALPVVIGFSLVQRHFIQGLTAGAVKS